MKSSVGEFIKNISSICEDDYGDFMRLANLYLIQLSKEPVILYDENIRNKISKMKTYLQFRPNWDVKSTREKLLQDALYIDELISAHKQDWESPSL